MNTPPESCPRCGEGPIEKIRLRRWPLETGWLCYECDALWMDDSVVDWWSWSDLGLLLESRGVPGTYKEIENIPMK